MSLLAGVRAAVGAAAVRPANEARRAALRKAAAELPRSEEVLEELLKAMCNAIDQEGPLGLGFKMPPHLAPLWQEACLAYIGGCSKEQLSGWRWEEEADSLQSGSGELEVVPFLLHKTRAAIRQLHFDQLLAQEQDFDAQFQDEDQDIDEMAYAEATQEMALGTLWAFQDSMRLRDQLLPPLLEAAVRGGDAALPLAVARSLDGEREAKWGGAGSTWADEWEPKTDVQCRFPARFRAAVRALLLANHRGLPGTDHQGGPIHLPREVLLGIVRGMAAPEAEAAWAHLVGPLPDWVDLNSDLM